ncbi:pyridoxal phosphate-dependent transferase [Lipomyces doorenjongii]
MASFAPASREVTFDPLKIPQAPGDPLYGLVTAYEADKSSEKVDLGVGAYRDGNCKPWVLPVVQKAEKIYHDNDEQDHEYLPIAGLPEFTNAAQKLILGGDSLAIKENRVCSFQTISGTGAIHLAVYISSPSWPIHDQVFANVELPVRYYPYFRKETKMIDFDGMVYVLESAPKGSIIVLHACAHNPTGVDPPHDQWKKLAEIVKANSLFPFFDSAYQGFASGSLSEDNFAILYFVEHGLGLVVAQSNLGLYGQRVGAFHFVTYYNRVASQVTVLQRSEISSPPIYGAQIASIILNNKQLFTEWEDDLRTMSGRIVEMRKCLKTELERLQTPGNWDHITSQIGTVFTGLDVRNTACS